MKRASGGNLASNTPTLYEKCHGIFYDHRESGHRFNVSSEGRLKWLLNNQVNWLYNTSLILHRDEIKTHVFPIYYPTPLLSVVPVDVMSLCECVLGAGC